MANYGNGNEQQNFWNAPPPVQNQSQDFNFDMPDQFGQEL